MLRDRFLGVSRGRAAATERLDHGRVTDSIERLIIVLEVKFSVFYS